ncbi:MAG: hypothetical protein LBM73_03875 [Candidatus Nomurabacteria bacterium]|jgi:hypothetical protein|nr:hypothetical protein [Candidatus Nomurabacteria bacterium]
MKVLYHASPIKNLCLIRPRKTLSKNRYIGDFVFATDNLILAAMYLAPKGRTAWLNPAAHPPRLTVDDSPENFAAADQGGAIYVLPADKFEPTPQRELDDLEFVSRTPIRPLRKMVFASCREAFEQFGIELKFKN